MEERFKKLLKAAVDAVVNEYGGIEHNDDCSSWKCRGCDICDGYNNHADCDCAVLEVLTSLEHGDIKTIGVTKDQEWGINNFFAERKKVQEAREKEKSYGL